MNILAFTPIAVTPGELARRQRRYDQLSPRGIAIRLETLGEGSEVPRQLESPDDIHASEQALLDRYHHADLNDIDAVMPDCVLDPTVDDPRTDISVPVIGILKLTGHALSGLGLSVGALARNKAIASELDRKYTSYDFQSSLSAVQVLDLTVEDIAETQVWNAAVDRGLKEVQADVVINGCSAVEVSSSGPGPALVDPTALALKHLALVDQSTGVFSARTCRA